MLLQIIRSEIAFTETGPNENGAEWKWGHVNQGGSKWPIIGNSPCSSKKGGKENPRTSQAITFGGFQTTYHRLSEIYTSAAHISCHQFQISENTKMWLSLNVLQQHMDEWSRTSLLHRCLKKQMLDFQLEQMLEKAPKSQMLDFQLGRLWLTSLYTHWLTSFQDNKTFLMLEYSEIDSLLTKQNRSWVYWGVHFKRFWEENQNIHQYV